VRAELNIHFEDPVSTKIVRHELHKFNIHSRPAVAKPLTTEGNVQMRKRWCHDLKPGLQPTSLGLLADVLQEEWYTIPLEAVQNVYESIQRKTIAVLKAKCGQTPY
jgi:hypothetical protein